MPRWVYPRPPVVKIVMAQQFATVIMCVGGSMTIEQTISQISQLPIDDQLRIINTVWDQMAGESATQLSEAQRVELDARIERYKANPDSALTESQLREQLKARREGT